MSAPAPPTSLNISQDTWEFLLCDPVAAAFVIFGVQLDAFQAARLRYYWWIPNVIDSSGVSSGKTIIVFLFLCLRTILIPDHQSAIYYPTFGTGKREFWKYFTSFAVQNPAPIFRAQLGNPLKIEAGEELDGDGTVHGPDCFTATFKNGNELKMPAPSFMKDSLTQASLRLNTLVIEEWTHVDASSDGINKQLIDRTSRPSWNQFHPLWGNHILFSAHAQTRIHPSAVRHRQHERKVKAGDATYANIAYSYKDYSDLICSTGKSFRDEYRIESTINSKRNVCSATEWMGQGFGIWGANGEGWFTETALEQCVANGRKRGLIPVLSRAQFEEIFEKVAGN